MSNIWDDAKSILGIVAPTIGLAVGGPLGGLAATTLCKALGLPMGSSDAQLAAAVKTATPDQLLAIKQADNDFQSTMAQLQVDLNSLSVDDKKSARDREVAVRDNTPRNLGYFLVVSFVGIILAVIFGLAKVDSVVMGTLVGYIAARSEQVISYYFGSNASSPVKNETIANSVPISALPMLTAQATPLIGYNQGQQN